MGVTGHTYGVRSWTASTQSDILIRQSYLFPRMYRQTALVIAATTGALQVGAVAQGCATSTNTLPRLTSDGAQTGRLAPGESICYTIPLRQGEFARIHFSTEIGYLKARVSGPDRQQMQVTWTSAFSTAAPSLPIALEAPSSGEYLLELSVPRWVSFADTQAFRVEMRDWESAPARAARRQAVSNDHRVQWLRDNATRLRTIDPTDSDFADLAFLEDVLRDVRVVVLGESDNGGGSDVLAKTRLVRFLHERLGYDVIAFQAGIYSAAKANEALRGEPDPRVAMARAGLGLLVRSVESNYLLQYLATRARSDRPLDVTGFDSQLTGTAPGSLVAELQAFLKRRVVDSPFSDSASLESRLLAGTIRGQFRSGSTLPSVQDQARTIEALRETARAIERTITDREAVFWAQVCRSTATQIGLALNNARGADAQEFMRGLVQQLSDNLLWLVTKAHPDRKVIVWAHTLHAMRSSAGIARVASMGSTVGQGLWQAIGDKGFVIGLTSYDGRSHWVNSAEDYYQDLIPEQRPGVEFETLMKEAGHELAFVNLGTARARGTWLGGRFPSRALHLVPEDAEWSAALDALLFIRTQAPRTRVR